MLAIERGAPSSPRVEAQEPEPAEPEVPLLGALESVPVPLPPNLDDFVSNREAAIVLGKALFWDMQVGGDGRTACASCHFNAGADNRTKNTLAPRTGTFRGANAQLTAADFPFHRLADPNEKRSGDNPVIFDTSEVVGSQGVVKKRFLGINEDSAIDRGETVADPVFNVGGINVWQVTGRNAPTVINAVYNDRNFWDGRANRFFNGVNPFGDMDPDAKIWKTDKKGSLTQTRILLDNASLASQAVGPPNNDVEMSWNGRTFAELGHKMLKLRPLALQRIDPNDSVLGDFVIGRKDDRRGFREKLSYADLIRRAFPPAYWNSQKITATGHTQMEANFSLFWGLSIMLYESTLVSNDSPFDRYMKGNQSVLSAKAKEGLEIFTNQGKCIACHSGPEFTGAAISQQRGVLSDKESMVEFMVMGNGGSAFYDKGFYNIGVRPTAEDLGVGGRHPTLGPWALARRLQEGQRPDLNGRSITIGPSDRIAVDGAFKTPTLRNVELTGPYMHNGGMKSLTEVVQFYARRADFFEENIDNLDPDVDGIGHIRGNEARVQAVVEFLKSLTDERVRNQAAPFDHPELIIPNGASGFANGEAIDNQIVIPAVGKNGGPPIPAFDKVVR